MMQNQQPMPGYDGTMASCFAIRAHIERWLDELSPAQRASASARIEQAGREAIARINAQRVAVSIEVPNVPALQAAFRELP